VLVCHLVRQSFFCDWGAPGQVRGLCRDHLTAVLGHSWEAENIVADTVAVLNELVTNSIDAECTAVFVEVNLHHDHVWLAVEDTASGQPSLQRPDEAEVRGRGLQIVEGLARSWGVTPLEQGKQVWAVLPVPRQMTADLECSVTSLV
jgi:hypothetical protein